ncbi:uncharacterized protein [Triticum aestivum]|uniref:uncharacterized protein n=1 Tax=Triticum aestivum TaxID=4565 RepID=UPI001D02D218|nr:uncharacterized protein LOC123149606 [Triticum aestivum]
MSCSLLQISYQSFIMVKSTLIISKVICSVRPTPRECPVDAISSIQILDSFVLIDSTTTLDLDFGTAQHSSSRSEDLPPVCAQVEASKKVWFSTVPSCTVPMQQVVEHSLSSKVAAVRETHILSLHW